MSPWENDSSPLTDAHAALHRLLEESVYDVLAALVNCNITEASARWRAFVSVLQQHMAFEDEQVLPAYSVLAPAEGPGRADHVHGDHVILHRHVRAIEDLFANCSARQPPPLREVLEELPLLYRLLGTLEHHTAREQTSVYPTIARHLPPPTLQEWTELLHAGTPSRVVEPPPGD